MPTQYINISTLSGAPRNRLVHPLDLVLDVLADAGILALDTSATQPSDTSVLWLPPTSDPVGTPRTLKKYVAGAWQVATPSEVALHILAAAASQPFSSANLTKLNGIETGAEVNPTGAEIIAAIDAVLGSSWKLAGQSYGLATSTELGLMASADKVKLDALPSAAFAAGAAGWVPAPPSVPAGRFLSETGWNNFSVPSTTLSSVLDPDPGDSQGPRWTIDLGDPGNGRLVQWIGGAKGITAGNTYSLWVSLNAGSSYTQIPNTGNVGSGTL